MNVVLCGFYPQYTRGLAVANLRSYLAADPGLAGRVAVSAFGFELSDPDALAVDAIRRASPDLLAFSCYIWNIEKVLRVCRNLRAAGLRAPIALGGPEVSHTAARTLGANPEPSVIVRGEGEETFRELVHHYLDGAKPIASIAGLSFRSGADIVETPDRPKIPDLNVIPSPYLDGTNDLGDSSLHNGLGTFETYRGCVFSCAFCLWGKTRNIRQFEMTRVEKELLAIMASGRRRIWCADAVANLDRERFKRMLRLMADKNPHGSIFDFEIVAEMLDEETIRLLGALPGGYVACGLQTTDPGARKQSERFSNSASFQRNIELLRRLAPNVELRIDLIFGLPGDTLRTFRSAVDYALSLLPDFVQNHHLLALPGTQFHRDARKLGLEHDGRPPYFVRRTPTFRPADFAKARRLAAIGRLYNRVDSVKLAAALACPDGRGMMEWLERLAGFLPRKSPGAMTPRQVCEGFERFLSSGESGVPGGAFEFLADFNRYCVFSQLAAPTGSAGRFPMGALTVAFDFSGLRSWKEMLGARMELTLPPRKKSVVVFDQSLLDEPFPGFQERVSADRPGLRRGRSEVAA